MPSIGLALILARWHHVSMSKLFLTTRPLLCGKAVAFRGEEKSAFVKEVVTGSVIITRNGLEGDEQADRVNHGGPDKALHLYPQEHYAYWQDFLGGHALLESPGAFGENITSEGATEAQLCLGDRFRFGTALIEISHGRKPCWKIDHRFGVSGITAEIVRNGRCGIYFRVLEEGRAQAGDNLELVERTLPDWSIERLFRLLIGGRAKEDIMAVRALASMDVLAEAWRQRAAHLVT